ncbi:MAG: signal transduction histidine kinase/DNA-binding response OmpR family regulator [Cyclobacteriaceae bacterium]|jgi:signal transduction histidine kinase/DNA-binding response OmpR family regulator/ligand-binding sensor domain-containing protein
MRSFYAICLNIFILSSISAGPSRVFFKLSTFDGLSFGAVSSVTQDSLGFIWVGTKDGLNRYDGSIFKIYNTQNSNLLGNGVSKIFIDSSNQMWVGTYNGLYLYNPQMDTLSLIVVENNNDRSSTIQVNDIVELNGKLYVASEDGLYEISLSSDNCVFKKIDVGEIGKSSIKALCLSDSTLFIGTKDRGLWQLDLIETEQIIMQVPYDLDDINIRAIERVGDNLFIGTWKKGLIAVNLNKTFSEPVTTLIDEKINSIDWIDNILWIGTGDRLIEIDSSKLGKQSIYSNNSFKYSLSPGGISCTFKDRDGNLWFGSTENGLNVIDNRKSGFKTYFIFNKENETMSCQDIGFSIDEGFFIGADGIYRTDSLSGDLKKSEFLNSYTSISFLDRGRILFGSYMDGFVLSNRGNLTTFKKTEEANSLSHNHVRDGILIDTILYISTWGGGLNAYNLNSKDFTSYRHDEMKPKSLSDDDIVSMVKEDDSTIWLATYGGGVNRFNTKSEKFDHFKSVPLEESTLSSNDVITLFIDSRNILWIGSWGGGLDYLNITTGEVVRVSDQHKLPYNIVTAIEEDELGRIWFSSKSGIGMYDFDNDKIYSYTLNDLHNNSFNIGAVTKDESGVIYFGSNSGCLAINNNQLDNQDALREMYFTSISVLGDVLDSSDPRLKAQLPYRKLDNRIFLEHDDQMISFQFANLTFPSSKNYSYEVMMKGFDQSWRSIGKSNYFTYTNLNPGDYTLQIRGSSEGASKYIFSNQLFIHIAKPWWGTTLAFLIYSIIFAFLLLSFFLYSVQWAEIKNKLKIERILRRKDNELSELKQRFFTNLSHEVRTPITLIINSIESLAENLILKKDSEQSFNNIKRNALHLKQLADEILEFKRIDASSNSLTLSRENLVEFCHEIFLSFSDLAQRKGLKYSFHSSPAEISIAIDREQMEKVLYNLISNAIKFTPSEGVVSVSLDANEQNGFIRVIDSGEGISSKDFDLVFQPFAQGGKKATQNKQGGFGLGLYITKEIILQHKGEINIESTINKGTTFSVRIPLNLNAQIGFGSSLNRESLDSLVIDIESTVSSNFPEIIDKSVLIVEDNQELRSYLADSFLGYEEVLTANNGQEGFEIALERIPDIIISDVMMPEMDGITMTRKLKSDKRTSHIPIIILTARTSLLYKHEGYETGADEYLTKPFSKSLLLSRARNLLLNRKLVAERIRQDILTAPSELSLNSKDEEFIEELIQVIDQNLLEKEITATFLAREMGMSHSLIYKKLKALTGMSFIEFIRDYRIGIAAKLISELGYSVSDAAFKVGFSDTKYFSKIFKKKFGTSPSKYGRS